MTHELPDDEPINTAGLDGSTITDPDPPPGTAAEVAFVMPASIFESVVTDLHDQPTIVVATQANPGPDRVKAVDALGDRLDQRFEELKSLFQREARAEAAREKVIDRLHAELQEYKQDLLLSTMRPVFIDLIQLHDDIGKVAVAPDGSGDDDQAEARRLVGLMEGFRQGIEDILYRQGVEPFQVDGDSFDPRRQRAVATAATDDPALNKTVAARLRKGFRAGERVIRPELVSVYAPKK